MVLGPGGTPMSSVEEGVEATLRLIDGPVAGRRDGRLLQRHARVAAGRPGRRRRRSPPAVGGERAPRRPVVTRWIVDGMNVVGSRPTGWWHDRPGAMQQLVHELQALGRAGHGRVRRPPVRGAGRRGRRRAVRVARRPRTRLTTTSPRSSPTTPTRPGSASSPPTAISPSACARTGRPSWGRSSFATGFSMSDPRYSVAMLDWLACAARGRGEPAARAARELGDAVAFAGTAGHVLDFDDTYLPGHRPPERADGSGRARGGGRARAERRRGARRLRGGLRGDGRVWRARAIRRSTTGAGIRPRCAAGSGPPWRRRHCSAARGTTRWRSRWRARAGCGRRSGRTRSRSRSASRRRAASMRRAWRRPARGCRSSARRRGSSRRPAGATRSRTAGASPPGPAVADNWIKAWPCCLQTHGAIEAADRLTGRPGRARGAGRHGPPGVAAGGGGGARARATACRRSSRSRT